MPSRSTFSRTKKNTVLTTYKERTNKERITSFKKILITNNVLLLICYFQRKAHFHNRFVRKIELVPRAYFQRSRTTGSEPLKQYFLDIMVRFYVTEPPYCVYFTLTLYTVGHLKSDFSFVKRKRKSGPEKSGYSYQKQLYLSLICIWILYKKRTLNFINKNLRTSILYKILRNILLSYIIQLMFIQKLN